MMNFKKSVHNALWGSESWEISAHLSDPSVIADGAAKSKRLNEVYPNFPLLFKVIDAEMRFSVQVHPNEETCKVTGGEPKTEMWCALSDGPIYAVQRRGIVETPPARSFRRPVAAEVQGVFWRMAEGKYGKILPTEIKMTARPAGTGEGAIRSPGRSINPYERLSSEIRFPAGSRRLG